MDAHNPVGPDSMAYLIAQYRERTEHEMDRKADMRAGAVLAAIDGLWDDLARHGAATARPGREPGCPEHCRDNAHYLTISQPDGSMHHTLHIDHRRITELNRSPLGSTALAAYRDHARSSLLRIEPPDRPAPSREGMYVVTPPDAANVSAASVIEISAGDRLRAVKAHQRAGADS